MKIALVNESFDERRGGAERSAVLLSGALERRGHEVRRIARDLGRGRIAGALALAGAAARARAEGDVVVSLCRAPGDVVYPQEGVHLARVAGSLARHGTLARTLLAVGKLLSPREWAFLASEGSAPAARPGAGPFALLTGRPRPAPRLYLALSRRIRDDMIRLWHAPPDAIEVCPNGVDCERFAPATAGRREAARRDLGIGGEQVAVLFVSNHFALRGLGKLIRALALADGPFRLVVAGRGRTSAAERLSAALGVATRFAGEVADVRPLLAAADIFALPTFYDTCSLSTLEALASAIPVLTTRANGASELLTGSEGAVIHDARDVGAIAAALARLRDAGRRRECAAAAREAALRNTLERALARVAELIEAACGASPRHSPPGEGAA